MSKKKQPVVNEMQDKTKAYQQDKLEYIKSPVVMEFLGLPSDSSLKESKLESAIIDNLEKFLMEMGKGYALVARQQHIRTEENDYYIDLVFYNYLIKSFILVDLKVNRITYQDVGQMDMYLQMYDKMKKGPDDNPTIGIILCAETDSDVARYSTLAKNDQMFAAKYKLYLPDKEDLRREIERQKELYLMTHPEENEKSNSSGSIKIIRRNHFKKVRQCLTFFISFLYNYPFIYKTITFSCIRFAISDIYAYLCRC